MEFLELLCLVYLVGALITVVYLTILMRGFDRNSGQGATQRLLQEISPGWSRLQVALLGAVLWPGVLLVLLVDGE